jgi:hypothetical protein
MLDFLADRYGDEAAPWDRQIAAIGDPPSRSHHGRIEVA